MTQQQPRSRTTTTDDRYTNQCEHDTLTGMRKTLADTLRAAIRESGHSAMGLSRLTGVSQQRISGFLKGKDMRLTNAHKLADFLGLSLRPKRPERKRK